ncbi:hypothetical protein H072_9128 [Dactylellina haptotyla CBS 200.50]|uniref:Uncharacterized protein n=1 Tax=Dactylellina haptotyla (strain CBS 200.50) TaxID=1284197 RepID=S8A3A4_DACHA|nr:hypothetical protein H072_9128 [Dactylellina haptotyla CBS 200.50]
MNVYEDNQCDIQYDIALEFEYSPLRDDGDMISVYHSLLPKYNEIDQNPDSSPRLQCYKLKYSKRDTLVSIQLPSGIATASINFATPKIPVIAILETENAELVKLNQTKDAFTFMTSTAEFSWVLRPPKKDTLVLVKNSRSSTDDRTITEKVAARLTLCHPESNLLSLEIDSREASAVVCLGSAIAHLRNQNNHLRGKKPLIIGRAKTGFPEIIGGVLMIAITLPLWFLG